MLPPCGALPPPLSAVDCANGLLPPCDGANGFPFSVLPPNFLPAPDAARPEEWSGVPSFGGGLPKNPGGSSKLRLPLTSRRLDRLSSEPPRRADSPSPPAPITAFTDGHAVIGTPPTMETGLQRRPSRPAAALSTLKMCICSPRACDTESDGATTTNRVSAAQHEPDIEAFARIPFDSAKGLRSRGM